MKSESILSPNEYIARNTDIRCNNDRLNIKISFESIKSVAVQLTGDPTLEDDALQVSLNECHVQRLNDYFIFSTNKNSCGSRVSELNGKYTLDNQLMFWYKTTTDSNPLMSKPLPKATPHLVDRSDSEIRNVAKKSMMLFPLTFTCTDSDVNYLTHKLQLYSDSNFTKRVDESSNPIPIHEHNYVFVEAQTLMSRGVSVFIDRCWLSNSSASLSESNQKFIIIENGCPRDLSVAILSSKGHQRFKLQLSHDFANKSIFLHCKLTSCLSTEAKKREEEHLKLCSELNKTCGDFSLHLPKPRRPPTTYYNIEVFGPIIVLPKLKTKIPPSFIMNPASTYDHSGKGTTKVTVEAKPSNEEFIGLATLPVILIATSSFLIGATFVSILWFIHWRTDASKHNTSRRQQSSHSSSSSSNHESHMNQKTAQLSFGFDFSSNSAESSPSSQRRMPLNISSNAVH